MQVTARHERDDRDIELDADQVKGLEDELGLAVTLADLFGAGIRSMELEDGWTYRLQAPE